MKRLFPLIAVLSVLSVACGATESSEAPVTPADFQAPAAPTVSPSSWGPTPLVVIYTQNRPLQSKLAQQLEWFNARTCIVTQWLTNYSVVGHGCFSGERPELILMDAQLWSGYSTAQEVDSIRTYAWSDWSVTTPVVLISENSRMGAFTSSLDVDGFLDIGTEAIVVNDNWDDALAYLGTWLANPVYDQGQRTGPAAR